jgi:hypothetical protein
MPLPRVRPSAKCVFMRKPLGLALVLLRSGAAVDGQTDSNADATGIAALQRKNWDGAIASLLASENTNPSAMNCYLLAYAYGQKKDDQDTLTYPNCVCPDRAHAFGRKGRGDATASHRRSRGRLKLD